MKKILWIAIIGLLIIPTGVFAKSSISLDCNKTNLNRNESFTCDIIVNVDSQVASAALEVNTSDEIIFDKLVADKIWDNTNIEDNTIYVASNDFVKSGTKIATLYAKTKKDISTNSGSIKVSNVELSVFNNGALAADTNVDTPEQKVNISTKVSSGINYGLIAVGVVAVIAIAGGIVLVTSKKKKK